MRNEFAKVTVCALTGLVILAGSQVNAYALPTDTALAGISIPLEKTYEAVGSMAAANVEDYVNIRSGPSEESSVLGKLYSGEVATITGQEGEWYLVSSGSVEGYIKREYLLYGDEAGPLIEAAWTSTATVNAEVLHVRADKNMDAEILGTLQEGEQVAVEESLPGWEKISFGEQEGYISQEFVSLESGYEAAESIEEEQARLAQEAALRQESLRQEMVDFSKQFLGNPYVWGGTSLTNGTDCSGFVQSLYAHFGYSIPRDSRSQAAGAAGISEDEMQPGDLLFYSRGGSINHVAMYIGDGQIIHASNPKTGIKISPYNYRQPVKVVSYI
jgi:cell wall-associated NlpC family hydrolase